MDRVTELVEEALTHLAAGDLASAAQFFAAADAQATAVGSPKARLSPLLGLLELAARSGEIDAVLSVSEVLAKVSRAARVPELTYIAAVVRVEQLLVAGRIGDALDACPAAFATARAFDDGAMDERRARVHATRGRAFLELGRPADAVADLRESLRLGMPLNSAMRVTLALARVRSGESVDAMVGELEELLDLCEGEERETARLTLAELRLIRGEVAAARRSLGTFEGASASSARRSLEAEVALAEGDPLAALSLLEEGGGARFAYQRARAFTELGQVADAIVAFAQAEEAAATEGEAALRLEAMLGRGESQLAASDPAGCRAIAHEVIRLALDPRLIVSGHVLLARERHLARDMSRARAHFEDAVATARAHGGPLLRAMVALVGAKLGLLSDGPEALYEAALQADHPRLIVESLMYAAREASLARRDDEAIAKLAEARARAASEPLLLKTLDAFEATIMQQLAKGGDHVQN